MMRHRFSGKILGGLKQKHKKQPFSDAKRIKTARLRRKTNLVGT